MLEVRFNLVLENEKIEEWGGHGVDLITAEFGLGAAGFSNH